MVGERCSDESPAAEEEPRVDEEEGDEGEEPERGCLDEQLSVFFSR